MCSASRRLRPRGWNRGAGRGICRGLPLGTFERRTGAPPCRALRRGTGNLPRRPYASSFNHDLSGTDVAIGWNLHARDAGRVTGSSRRARTRPSPFGRLRRRPQRDGMGEVYASLGRRGQVSASYARADAPAPCRERQRRARSCLPDGVKIGSPYRVPCGDSKNVGPRAVGLWLTRRGARADDPISYAL